MLHYMRVMVLKTKRAKDIQNIHLLLGQLVHPMFIPWLSRMLLLVLFHLTMDPYPGIVVAMSFSGNFQVGKQTLLSEFKTQNFMLSFWITFPYAFSKSPAWNYGLVPNLFMWGSLFGSLILGWPWTVALLVGMTQIAIGSWNDDPLDLGYTLCLAKIYLQEPYKQKKHHEDMWHMCLGQTMV